MDIPENRTPFATLPFRFQWLVRRGINENSIGREIRSRTASGPDEMEIPDNWMKLDAPLGMDIENNAYCWQGDVQVTFQPG